MRKGLALLLLLLWLPCAAFADEPNVYLYGEQHAVDAILQRELELWQTHYSDGLRHLFVELPYYTAQYLNQWMQEDDDQILINLYMDWEGTSLHSENVLSFCRAIKTLFPQTVFHGTDVGHQYATTGTRYLAELEAQSMQETQAYSLSKEAIAQGQRFYQTGDAVYRENMMNENLVREWAAVGESIVGIYGSAHTVLQSLNHTGEVQNMATQLYTRFGDCVISEDLSPLSREIAPLSEETVVIAGKTYTALFFGAQDISVWFPQYKSRAFWRIEGAYEDVKDLPLNGNVLPDDNYPMATHTGEVFMIDYTHADGRVEREYYRHDGDTWNGKAATYQFLIP